MVFPRAWQFLRELWGRRSEPPTGSRGLPSTGRKPETYPCFDIEGISVDRLLREWTWLADGAFRLVAVNAFGDLFLEDTDGAVHWLDITEAKLSQVAASASQFREAAKDVSKQDEWLLAELALEAGKRGLNPGKAQCVGYKIPVMFKESATAPNNAFVADLYEFVSFMGDVHRQMKNVPEGTKIKLKLVP